MEDSRYLQCLAADYGDLRDAASAAELTANVPSCPGWTVADLVRHVAQVYLHKVALMRTGEEPEEWPPPSLAAEAPLAALGRAYGALRAEFRTRGPGLPALTWYDPDQTVAFWIRRMAQETVIHRIDAELAAGLPVTPVPDDLAADGVDEVLKRMLAYGSVTWPEDFAEMEGEHLRPDRARSRSPRARRPGRSARRRTRWRWKTVPATTPGSWSRAWPATCCAGCGAGPATTRSGRPATPPGRITCAGCSSWSPSKPATGEPRDASKGHDHPPRAAPASVPAVRRRVRRTRPVRLRNPALRAAAWCRAYLRRQPGGQPA